MLFEGWYGLTASANDFFFCEKAAVHSITKTVSTFAAAFHFKIDGGEGRK